MSGAGELGTGSARGEASWVLGGPLRRAGVRCETLNDGSAVLYDPERRMAYPITATAAWIWDACDGHSSVAFITEQLAARYEAPRETIERDVRTFLEQLHEMGLLTESRPDGP